MDGTQVDNLRQGRHQVDNLLTVLGNPGRFQVITFFLLSGNYLLNVCNTIAPVFYTAKTRHHCRVENTSLIPVVTRDNERQWDGCIIYTASNSSTTIPCPNGWVYYFDDGESTIISEFGLVCDDAYKADLSTSIYFLGMIIGGPMFGYFGDRFGRRTVIGFLLLTSSMVGGGVFLFRNYVVYIVLRFVLGCLMQGLSNSSIILVVELFPTKFRVYAVLILMFLETFSVLVFDLLSYLIRDWKYIQLTLAMLTLVQLLTMCFIPESLRWYLIHGQFDKAESFVRRVAKFNKLPYPSKLIKKIENDFGKSCDVVMLQRQKKANLMDVIRSPTLLKITLVISFIWFTSDSTFFLLALNMSFLHGDKYLNIAISYLADLFAILVLVYFLPRFGRRKPLFFLMLCCSVAVGGNATITLSSYNSAALQILRTVLVIMGKISAFCTFAVLVILTSEVYPTIVRNVSLGVNTFSSRLGAMVAPQMILLGKHTTSSVPFAVLCIFALVSGLLIWLLPETHNKDFSDKLDCTREIYGEKFMEKDFLAFEERILAYETSI